MRIKLSREAWLRPHLLFLLLVASQLSAEEQAGVPLVIQSETPELHFIQEELGEQLDILESEVLEDPAGGVATLIENAESGTGGVSYQTTSYGLLQSSVVSQGSYAFHLANRWNDYFTLTTDLAPTATTKLFFQSQLSWSASDQVAKVQVSTDGGASWSADIFSQAGDGGSGEGDFSLKEISLSTYAGSTIRLRFIYEFSFGSFFSQTDPGVGWHVDNIQIGEEFQKDLYTGFGNPTDDEQHYLEFINRARAAASVEAARLRDETDPLVTAAYSNWGLNTDHIVSQFAWHVFYGCMEEVAQPLAFNATLLQMARLHTQDMFDNSFQSHTNSSNPPSPLIAGGGLGNRIAAVGYTGYTNAGENIYSYAKSVAHGHAGFDVDWGTLNNDESSCYNSSFTSQGMQNPPGHRLTIHNDVFSEIGIGVITGSNGGVGPQVVTQNFGNSGGTRVTGVVYQDLNSNGFYDPGEGVSGVRVEIEESANYAESSSSGGYALPVPGNGTYTVEFSGAGIADWNSSVTVTNSKNVKLDYIVASLTGYALWASNHGVVGGISDDDDDDGVDNGFEYGLLGYSSTTADPEVIPVMTSESSGDFSLSFSKNPQATDLLYKVKTSVDGITWTTQHVTITEENENVLSVIIAGGEPHLLITLEVDLVE